MAFTAGKKSHLLKKKDLFHVQQARACEVPSTFFESHVLTKTVPEIRKKCAKEIFGSANQGH